MFTKDIEMKKMVLISTLFWGIVGHGYSYFNLFYSHDSLIVPQNDMDWQVGIGRVLQPLYIFLRGEYFPPTLIGFLSLLFIGISIYLIVKLLDFRKFITIFVISGILIVNVTLILLNATYIQHVDVYSLSLLMSVLCVKLFDSKKYFLSVLVMVASLSLYQSYFQVGVTLITLICIKKLWEEDPYKNVIKYGFKFILILCISFATYYIFMKGYLYFSHTTMLNSYNGLTEVGKYTSKRQILTLVAGSYAAFIDYYLNPMGVHPTFLRIINVLLIIILMYVIYKKGLKKEKNNAVLSVFLIFLLPLTSNLVYIISKGFEHHLMIYSFFVVYLLFFMLEKLLLDSQEKFSSVINKILILLLVAIPFINIIYANQVYLKKHFEYNAGSLTVNRIIDRLENTEGYVWGETPILFVGRFPESKYMASSSTLKFKGAGLGDNFFLTFDRFAERYIHNVLGYQMNIVQEDYNLWLEKDEVKSMPLFPDKNSVRFVDGVLVVKVANK